MQFKTIFTLLALALGATAQYQSCEQDSVRSQRAWFLMIVILIAHRIATLMLERPAWILIPLPWATARLLDRNQPPHLSSRRNDAVGDAVRE